MKRHLTAQLLLLAAALAASAAHAAPREVLSTWNVYKGSMKLGVMTQRYVQTGDRYRIDSELRGEGLVALIHPDPITQKSAGAVRGEQLLPSHFEQRDGNKADKTLMADFDWPRHSLTLRQGGQTETARLAPGTQDALSFFYQMMLTPPKEPFSALMATGRKVERGAFRIAGRGTLPTALGELETVHLSRQHGPDEKDMDVWLAPAKRYFPVRIRFDDKGDVLEQRLVRLQIDD